MRGREEYIFPPFHVSFHSSGVAKKKQVASYDNPTLVGYLAGTTSTVLPFLQVGVICLEFTLESE